MRRILLIVAMLLLAAAPVMATVTVSAIQNAPTDAFGKYTTAGRACNILDVTYSCGAGEDVRAFALEITLDNGFIFSSIQDFKRGESNSTAPGYGIFPGSFRTVLAPADVNWLDPNYRPIASTEDVDAAGTGLGTNKVILEMGSLYVGEANKPGSSGTLCRLVVDPNMAVNVYGPKESNLTFAVNALRGGVVLTDGSAATTTLVAQNGQGVANKFSFPKLYPCWAPYTTSFNEWIGVWEPRCWGALQEGDGTNWRYQCLGDADNKPEGTFKYRAYKSDFARLSAAWTKRATQLRATMGTDGAGYLMCADFDHKPEGTFKYRVYKSDFTILSNSWTKRETQLLQFGPCPKPN